MNTREEMIETEEHLQTIEHRTRELRNKLTIALHALKQIERKKPMKVGREEAADMAIEFQVGASEAIKKIGVLE